MREWHDLTTVDFEAADPETWVAILPVSATEQHGPHLPVATDAILMDGLIEATRPLVDPAVPALLLPHIPIGKSNEHAAFPGTLTFSTPTLMSMWTEIGESVHRAGIRKLIIVNMHGGQPQIVDIVVRDLRVRLNMLAISANGYGLGAPEDTFSAFERRHGFHGGESETSLVLHIKEEAVRKDKVDNFVASTIAIEEEYEVLRLEGVVGAGWMTQDVNPAGAIGNAAAADAARGKLSLDFKAERFAKLIEEVSRFPLSALRQAPASHMPQPRG